ncbi:hypothetical protein HID58_077965 [Brassica napus]|uniref:Inhibitor I9 domain-containing protein n=1 Tax=Brassica napus TaxID=3708 RepID=A0ABQ7YTI8_BRANA|nr:hypothetical protein HID58_077965 [Brassica napus]
MEKNTLHTYKLVLLFACSLVLFLNTELSFLASAKTLDNDSKAFYLGERVHDDPTASHHEMLESLLESKEDAHNSMIYSYQHGFSGFAALLTSTQANKISVNGASRSNPCYTKPDSETANHKNLGPPWPLSNFNSFFFLFIDICKRSSS